MLNCTDAINTKPKKASFGNNVYGLIFIFFLKKQNTKGSDIREMCYRLAHGGSFGYRKRTSLVQFVHNTEVLQEEEKLFRFILEQ